MSIFNISNFIILIFNISSFIISIFTFYFHFNFQFSLFYVSIFMILILTFLSIQIEKWRRRRVLHNWFDETIFSLTLTPNCCHLRDQIPFPIISEKKSARTNAAVRIHRILLRGVARIVGVSYGHAISFLQLVEYLVISETESTLAMGDPNAHDAVFHPLEHHRRRFFDFHRRPTALESLGFVMDQLDIDFFIFFAWNTQNPWKLSFN